MLKYLLSITLFLFLSPVWASDVTFEPISDFKSDLKELYKDFHFNQLDQLAEELRYTKKKSEDGYTYLAYLYNTLKLRTEKERQWSKIQSWAKVRDNSPTPQVLLAQAYLEKALVAYDFGGIYQIGNPDYEDFEALLNNAKKHIKRAEQLTTIDTYLISLKALHTYLSVGRDPKFLFKEYGADQDSSPKKIYQEHVRKLIDIQIKPRPGELEIITLFSNIQLLDPGNKDVFME